MCGWMVHACLIHYSLLHRYKGHSSTLRFGGLDCLNERLGSCDEGRGELIEGTCDVYCGELIEGTRPGPLLVGDTCGVDCGGSIEGTHPGPCNVGFGTDRAVANGSSP